VAPADDRELPFTENAYRLDLEEKEEDSKRDQIAC